MVSDESGGAALPHSDLPNAGPTPKVDVRDLSIRYGSHTALTEVTLSVAEREILGIFGPANGGACVLPGKFSSTGETSGAGATSMRCDGASESSFPCRSGFRFPFTTTSPWRRAWREFG